MLYCSGSIFSLTSERFKSSTYPQGTSLGERRLREVFMNSNRVLVASPDIQSRRTLVDILNREGLSTIGVSRVRDCQDVLAIQAVQLIFCESRLSDGDYRDVLALAQSAKQKVRVVVTSRLADWHEY